MKAQLFLPVLVVLFACESSTDIIYQPTELTLTVLDDRSLPVKGAQILLFTNEDDLNAFKQSGDLSQQQPVLTNDVGQVVFPDLDEQLRYYFFATYRDRTRFVDLENYNSSFAYPGFLIKGSKTRATIQLERADNVVVFYSLTQNQTQLPIDIFLDGDSVGRINQVIDQPPSSPNVSGTVSFRLRDGKTNWYSKSKLGCLWSGQFNLGATDNFTLQEFASCESGAITFWAENGNLTGVLPIRVTLNDKDNFGNLINESTSVIACFSDGLSGSREVGFYTYIATSANGQCTWTGSFTVTKGECSIVKLDKCN
ncbi:MAG: hypothetical protein ACK5DD_02155 [Cyclobacteriaceae bacterium]|jgi:hypothetical protein